MRIVLNLEQKTAPSPVQVAAVWEAQCSLSSVRNLPKARSFHLEPGSGLGWRMKGIDLGPTLTLTSDHMAASGDGLHILQPSTINHEIPLIKTGARHLPPGHRIANPPGPGCHARIALNWPN
jgi:hypothetical protein